LVERGVEAFSGERNRDGLGGRADLMGYTQKLLKELRSVGPSLQREFHKILKR
jgi:hypothetical protein